MKRPCALGAAALVGAIGIALALMNYLTDRAEKELDAVNPFGHDDAAEPVTEAGRVEGDAPKNDSAGPADTASMTKAELYGKATELGIKGRSKMTKAELASAIEKAS